MFTIKRVLATLAAIIAVALMLGLLPHGDVAVGVDLLILSVCAAL